MQLHVRMTRRTLHAALVGLGFLGLQACAASSNTDAPVDEQTEQMTEKACVPGHQTQCACAGDAAPGLEEVSTSVVPLPGRQPFPLAQMALTAQSALGGRFTLENAEEGGALARVALPRSET